MKENSIRNERSSMEETIKTIEKMIKSYKEADKCGLSNNDFKNEIKALEHILSDYRRLLKENETLKKEKEQAWEEWNNLEQGSYETEQKLKQQIKELQKENEELLELKVSASAHNRILELEKENEELHKEIERMKSLDIYKLVEDWETSQLIPIQKVKDKIEEIVEKIKHEENEKVVIYLSKQKNILQELLESEE